MIDLSSSEKKKEIEKRNLRFYKHLGQNYYILVNAILRGKDIYYDIPKAYQLNSNKPFILEWLLEYGRPKEIAQVRSIGKVKLLCIYNALMTWIEQNEEDIDKWVYWQEWEDYFSDNPKAKKRGRKPKKVSEVKKIAKKDVVLPELNFIKKKRDCVKTDGRADVFITLTTENKGCKNKRVHLHLRNKVHLKFESDYLCVAILDKRIYFKDSTVAEGYKIVCKNGKNADVTMTINKDEQDQFEPFLKIDLDLQFDELYQLYFVERE